MLLLWAKVMQHVYFGFYFTFMEGHNNKTSSESLYLSNKSLFMNINGELKEIQKIVFYRKCDFLTFHSPLKRLEMTCTIKALMIPFKIYIITVYQGKKSEGNPVSMGQKILIIALHLCVNLLSLIFTQRLSVTG